MPDPKRRLKSFCICGLVGMFGFAAGNYVGYSRGIPFTKRVREWSIGIYTGPSLFELADPANGTNPVLTKDDVTDVDADFVADPFMIHVGDTWYMFFEVLNAKTRHGDIGYATSQDGLRWTYCSIVLDEPFHLSYPHVFEWQDKHYMIPESYEASSVRLYEASNFPTEWTFVSQLVRDDLVDPTVFRHDDRWWMFASANELGNNKLAFYYADELTGPWIRHPQSPLIVRNPNIARPAGRVIQTADKLYRVSQDDHPSYGLSVGVFEITKLTLTDYEEKPVKVPFLEGGAADWNRLGLHQLDAHQLPNGQWIAAVDGHRKVSIFGLRY